MAGANRQPLEMERWASRLGLRLVGFDSRLLTTDAAAAAEDLSEVAGIHIPAEVPFAILCAAHKQATGAFRVGIGLKINGVDMATLTVGLGSDTGLWRSVDTDTEQLWNGLFLFGPRLGAGILFSNGLTMAVQPAAASGVFRFPQMDRVDVPSPVTSVTLTGITANAAVLCEADFLAVYALPAEVSQV